MPVRKKAKLDPLPKEFATAEAAAEFWEKHDATDYLEHTVAVKDLDIRIERHRFLIALEPSLARGLSEAARRRGISSEALLNVWLQEKLQTANGETGKG
jgi:hypothetical protein